MEAYAAACTIEIRRAVERESMAPATSVFFGGGTPSRLPADLLVEVLAAVPRRPGAEVTVECNPEDVDRPAARRVPVAGVTRISLGVQSTVGHVLEGLGRRHGPEHVASAAARWPAAGFDSWNLDLILGGAGERDEDLERASPTCWAGVAPTPSERLCADGRAGHPAGPHARTGTPTTTCRPAATRRRSGCSTGAGYRWEDISDWALPGHECRHNHLYWE